MIFSKIINSNTIYFKTPYSHREINSFTNYIYTVRSLKLNRGLINRLLLFTWVFDTLSASVLLYRILFTSFNFFAYKHKNNYGSLLILTIITVLISSQLFILPLQNKLLILEISWGILGGYCYPPFYLLI